MHSPSDVPSPFEVLTGEIRLAFHQLKATAESLHEDRRGLGAAHRGVLESLFRAGPQTVPALARARPVARQHIQILANRLIELGLVRTAANPANRRSPLLELSPAGRRKFEAMQTRERRAMAKAKLRISKARMKAAAETLRALRAALAAMADRRGAPATKARRRRRR